MVAAVFIPDQELVYLAMGLRCLAQRAREDAEKQESLVVRQHHLDAAEEYEELARKYDGLRTGR